MFLWHEYAHRLSFTFSKIVSPALLPARSVRSIEASETAFGSFCTRDKQLLVLLPLTQLRGAVGASSVN
jgi:hypothetical protein